ncbi:unnamed protein product [Protopolystoma xenopodis]|uniref:Uncharacterized protein n=1 Tax=Protopolystoma xenopodis TaxID=117903 RepID=A0A3S5CFB1_9PLAT|nr:unnamed protein product [Protopolystoma xenopodis]
MTQLESSDKRVHPIASFCSSSRVCRAEVETPMQPNTPPASLVHPLDFIWTSSGCPYGQIHFSTQTIHSQAKPSQSNGITFSGFFDEKIDELLLHLPFDVRIVIKPLRPRLIGVSAARMIPFLGVISYGLINPFFFSHFNKVGSPAFGCLFRDKIVLSMSTAIGAGWYSPENVQKGCGFISTKQVFSRRCRDDGDR